MNGALFPGHYIIPEYIVHRDQSERAQLEVRLKRIREAAERVFAYQWHDNDADAVKALEALRGEIQ